jgi:protein TonB
MRVASRAERTSSEERRDPLHAVLTLGDRTAKVGGAIALAIALSTHGVASARALLALYPLQRATRHIRSGIHDFLWTMYDVELAPDAAEAPKPPPPPPEPEPVAEPTPAPPAPNVNAAPKPPSDDPYEPPPTPAQAAKVLTAPARDDEPLDLTGQGFVTGDGSGPGYGMVSAAGTGDKPTFNTAANLKGKPGGTGTGAPAAPPPPVGPDLSKPPGLIGGTGWSCPFPPEADVDGVDQAIASIVVTVRPDGTPLSVKVVIDPGHGFGRAARLCALGRRFSPALDRAGQPITSTSAPIKVRFTR